MFILTEKLYFWFLFHGHKNNSLFTIPILAQVFTSVCTNIWQIFINPRKVFVYDFRWVFKIREYFDWELNGCCRQMMCWLSDIEELRSIRRRYITLQPRTFSPNLHRSQLYYNTIGQGASIGVFATMAIMASISKSSKSWRKGQDPG